jgi:benzoate membrane transport protein
MTADAVPQSVGAGILAAIVGYASAVAVVIHGLAVVGANESQIASALAVLCLGMGLCGVGLSLATRMPISIAWSTPGMALLGTLTGFSGGFAAAVGAFIAVGVMIMLTGLWTPLGRLISAIPKSIAGGMLGGILLKLCLAPFQAVREAPATALAIIGVWLVVGRFARLWAAPAALIVALGALILSGDGASLAPALPHLEWTMPVFSWQALISIGLPLYIVTMASQNIPGLTVLKTFDYQPATRPIFLATGGLSAVTAFFGAPTINLAAITAVLCAGPDAHPDPAKRYVAAVAAGLVYVGPLALMAAMATSLVTHSSPILIEAVAGLALIGAFGSSLLGAVQEEKGRLPALFTFLVTASGLSIGGIGAAFWGLCAGLVVYGLLAVTSDRA